MDARQARIDTRQGARTDRGALRTEARMTAYENGIDPNAWVADSIGHVGQATADIMGAKFGAQAAMAGQGQPGGGVNSLLDTLNKSKGPDGNQGDTPGAGGDLVKMALPIGLGLVALKMLK